ncbi:hypothetical protein JADG_010625 [Aureobasidium aubasidani]|nr:hypothetical protein JADG_010625 [Aureobasidium pullulans]
MRFICFSISFVWLLLTSSSATLTKRQALIDSIGDSTLDDIVSQIRNDGNLTLLGDLLEVAVDALTTEATAIAECYNPSVPFPAEFDGSGSGSGQKGARTGPGGTVSSLPSTTAAVSQLSSLLWAVASAATSVPDATKADTTLGQAAGAAASSALDFLSSASSAASVAPGISSLLMSIVDNTAALPSTAVASLVDAAMNAPSFVSTNVPTTPTVISFPLYYSLSTTTPAYGVNGEGYGGSKANGILYSTPNSIHTSTPIASTTFKASSFQLSADDNLATSAPTAAFNSPTSLALSHSSGKAESTNVVNSGDRNGIGDGQNVSGGSNEGSTDGTSSPALSSIHVTVVGGSPSSSAIAPWVSTTAYAGSSSSATRSSDLSGATETFRDGFTSSVLDAASSASNSAEILPSPTPSPPSQNACPFISTSVFTVSGSRFTRYCNRFYGGKVLELDGRVLKRQATNSIDSCIDTCAPESRCVGTSYESTSGFCTFYSSLVDGITRNGIQFAVRLDTASSVLDPNDAPASTTETSVSVSARSSSNTRSSVTSEAYNSRGSRSSSSTSQLPTDNAIGGGSASSLVSLSRVPTATFMSTSITSAMVDISASWSAPAVSGMSSVTGAGVSTSRSPGSNTTWVYASQPSSSFSQISTVGGSNTSASSSQSLELTTATSMTGEIVASDIPANTSSVIGVTASATTPRLDPSSSAVSESVVLSTKPLTVGSVSSTAPDNSGVSTAVNPSGIISSISSETSNPATLINDANTTTSGLVVPSFSSVATSIAGHPTSARSTNSSVALSATSDITVFPTNVLTSGLASSLVSNVSDTATAVNPSNTLGSISSQTTELTSAAPSISTTIIVSVTSTSATNERPPSSTDTSSITKSSAGDVSSLLPSITSTVLSVSTAISSDASSANASITSGIGASTSNVLNPTSNLFTSDSSLPVVASTLSGDASNGITATSNLPTSILSTVSPAVMTTTTSCGGALIDLCVTLGILDGVTINLGIGGGAGATPTATVSALSSASGGFTATQTQCDGVICFAVGVGPSITATIGAINTDGSIVQIGAGIGDTASTTASSVIPTTSSGANILTTSSSCDAGSCESITTESSTTINPGALSTEASSVGAGNGDSATPTHSASLITSAAVLTTDATISGTAITAISTSCSGDLLDLCVTLGLGPLGTVSIDVGVLPTGGSSAALTTSTPAITSSAALAIDTTISGTAVTAISTSCAGDLLDLCVTLGLGPLGTVSIDVGVLPTGGTSAAPPTSTPAITSSAALATDTTISGTAITAISTSCAGDLLDLCITLGLGPLGTISIDAGVLPTSNSGDLIDASVGATLLPARSTATNADSTITSPAVLPTSTIISGTTITALSTSCDDALVDVCLTVGIGPLGTITVDAGVLPTTNGLFDLLWLISSDQLNSDRIISNDQLGPYRVVGSN